MLCVARVMFISVMLNVLWDMKNIYLYVPQFRDIDETWMYDPTSQLYDFPIPSEVTLKGMGWATSKQLPCYLDRGSRNEGSRALFHEKRSVLSSKFPRIPLKKASNAETLFMPWHHHVVQSVLLSLRTKNIAREGNTNHRRWGHFISHFKDHWKLFVKLGCDISEAFSSAILLVWLEWDFH